MKIIMPTTKMLINWEARKVMITEEHRGSQKVLTALQNGYVEAADIKDDGRSFIKPEYFEPDSKYSKGNNNIDEIQT